MNISELLPYIPTALFASLLIALSIVAIALLPWSSQDLDQGQYEILFVWGIIKENMVQLLSRKEGQSLSKIH